MSEIKPNFGTLQGTKVLASTTALAAPLACALYAECGADVISIENPKQPELLRQAFGLGYCLEHKNKRNIALDVYSPEGRVVFEKMLQWADIFIENGKANGWAKRGYSDEKMWELNPRLVIVHVSAYGQYGDPDYVKLPGYDGLAQGFSGVALNNGDSESSSPLLMKTLTGDNMSGLNIAWSGLAAYISALKTGKGESVDLTLYEPLFRVQIDTVMNGLNLGIEPVRNGNRTVQSPAPTVFKCGDGNWIFLGFAQGTRLKDSLELFGLIDDPDVPQSGRIGSDNPVVNEKVTAAMQRFCDRHTSEEVVKIVSERGGLAGPFYTYKQILEHPHYAARENIIEWYDPHANQVVKGVAPQPKFKNNPSQVWRGSPTIGMDNEDILRQFGCSDEDIQSLYAKKLLAKDKYLEQ